LVSGPSRRQAYASRDDQNKAVLLTILFYVFAHIRPARIPTALMLEIMRGLVERGGLPSCSGEPFAARGARRPAGDPTGLLLVKRHAAGDSQRLGMDVLPRFRELPADVVAGGKGPAQVDAGGDVRGRTDDSGGKDRERDPRFRGSSRVERLVPDGRFQTSMRSAALANSVRASPRMGDWTFSRVRCIHRSVALAAAERSGSNGKQ